MRAIYDAAETAGLFAENDIKVRLRPFHYFRLGADKTDFIHVFGFIMEGRSAEQKANLSRKIIERLSEMFPDISILSNDISGTNDILQQGFDSSAEGGRRQTL